MSEKKESEMIPCTVEFTEGAMDRIAEGWAALVYGIKDGIYEGPLPAKDETA